MKIFCPGCKGVGKVHFDAMGRVSDHVTGQVKKCVCCNGKGVQRLQEPQYERPLTSSELGLSGTLLAQDSERFNPNNSFVSRFN